MNPKLTAPVSPHVADGAAKHAFDRVPVPGVPLSITLSPVRDPRGRIAGAELKVHLQDNPPSNP